MKIIVCVDDNNGMMFNKRRQSRDRLVTADVTELAAGSRLWMNGYSKPLFSQDEEGMKEDAGFLEKAGEDDYCFVENQSVQPYLAKIDEVIVYRWNRKYPADFYFDVDLHGWKMVGKKEFVGASHEKITRERYRKGEAE